MASRGETLRSSRATRGELATVQEVAPSSATFSKEIIVILASIRSEPTVATPLYSNVKPAAELAPTFEPGLNLRAAPFRSMVAGSDVALADSVATREPRRTITAASATFDFPIEEERDFWTASRFHSLDRTNTNLLHTGLKYQSRPQAEDEFEGYPSPRG